MKSSMSNTKPWVLAAKSIKAELNLRFPGVSFRVTSSAYANGNSVHVSWADGPTRKDVQAITSKYQEGNFDGMTDSYVLDEDPQHKEFHRLRGSAKYVVAH
jgi:hypothetical protein